MKSLNALVFGSLTVDTIAVIADNDIERVTMHNEATSFLLLEQGRKVDAESISSHIGGGAANVGVSMARQGHDVDAMGIVGNDLYAEKIREKLVTEGIGLDQLITHPELGSGNSVLVSSHDQNAAIFTHRGANTGLRPAHIEAIDLGQYDLVYIGPLSDESAECFPLIVQKAKAAGCFVAANPGIRQLTGRAEEFLSTLGAIDLLSLNRVELMALLPCFAGSVDADETVSFTGLQDDGPQLLRRGLKLGALTLPLGAVMAALCRLGPARFVLTDGRKGAYLFEDDVLHFCPAVIVEPKGTAGAGDAFASTVVAQIASGAAPADALKAASHNSASVVAHIDTQTGLLTADDLTKRLSD